MKDLIDLLEMKVKITHKIYLNIKCDSCGVLADEMWWDCLEGVSMEDWHTTEDGKHYCNDCFECDENGVVTTKPDAEVWKPMRGIW